MAGHIHKHPLSAAPAPWPAEASSRPGSPYRRLFRNGATLFPRRLVLVEPAPMPGMLPPNPEFPMIRGRTGTQDKEPWKTVEPPQGRIKKDFLHPVLLGESIAPFRVLTPQQAVIPWDVEGHGTNLDLDIKTGVAPKQQLMDARTAAARGHLELAQWLEKTEALWERHKRSPMSFLERCDYYGNLSCQFPPATVRIVYTKAGTHLAACAIEESAAIIDHMLYWAAVESLEEARYLCGILNSEALRSRVEQYQVQGQWGARHFDKYVFNLPIPRFDASKALHGGIAQAAERAEEIADAVEVKEDEHFTRTRARVRSTLAEHGVAAQLEQLVGKVLRDT